MADEKIFADGFIFKRNENAPDWVVGSLAVKCEEAIAFLKTNHKNGWCNLNINMSKGGKYYVELDTFVPKKQEATQPKPVDADKKDLPF
mgnify:CR=1 FL=1|jgi:23S rRNA C2498 (ribose-2'-O)-methylase RlmM